MEAFKVEKTPETTRPRGMGCPPEEARLCRRVKATAALSPLKHWKVSPPKTLWKKIQTPAELPCHRCVIPGHRHLSLVPSPLGLLPALCTAQGNALCCTLSAPWMRAAVVSFPSSMPPLPACPFHLPSLWCAGKGLLKSASALPTPGNPITYFLCLKMNNQVVPLACHYHTQVPPA